MSYFLQHAAVHMPRSLRAVWQHWVESFRGHELDIEDVPNDVDDSCDLDCISDDTAVKDCQPSDSCQPESALASTAASVGLLEVVFGSQWLADGAFAAECRSLSESLSAGDRATAQLVGQLLVFHAAPADRIATVLKDLGESYYKWRQQRPSATADAFGLALVDWVNERCHLANSSNRVERVEPGDRFDAHRHQSAGRGATVSQPHGWVVTRADGKVYSRAQVTVR
jgi:hypothetical protein